MYKLINIRNGDAGTKDTLKYMNILVKKCKTNQLVRETALNIISQIQQKNFTNEARYIHAFVRDRIRYAKDVKGVETPTNPNENPAIRPRRLR